MGVSEALRRGAFALAPALIYCSLLTASSAQAAVSIPHGAALIKVNACNPALNFNRGGYVGYAPGFWGGPYWYDPWGVRYYQPAYSTANPQLGIDYVNISTKTMTQIEFGLMANGVLRAEVRDVGTFSPGAEIKHTFSLSANVFPLQTALARCVPLRIHFADGTKWRNARLPAKNKQIYHS